MVTQWGERFFRIGNRRLVLRMPTPPKLDHTVINVGYQMDAAEPVFKGLGFHLTDRGYHSLGSINHLMMFGTDYLELIGLPASAKGTISGRPDVQNAPIGINGLVFKSDDVDETYAHLQSIGMAAEPPKSFGRPVELDGVTSQAKFRTVTVAVDAFPGGRVYFCEHLTPELVWRPEWQTHANGATSISEFTIVSTNPDQEAENIANLLHSQVDGEGERLNVPFDGGKITLLSPEAYKTRYGALASPMGQRTSIFGAMTIQSNDLSAVRAIAKEAALPTLDKANNINIRVPEFDSVLEFVS